MAKNILTIIALLLCINASFSQQIKRREYFIDTDPGVGLGTIITYPTAQDSINETITINTTGLSVGFHIAYVRYRSNTGSWGIPEGNLFYVFNSTTPTATINTKLKNREYFIDTDPGVGLGIGITTYNTLPDSITETVAIPATGLSVGYHIAYVRYRNNLGAWGIAEGNLFYVYSNTPPIITVSTAIRKGEYFIDTDPGVGLGTALSSFTQADSIVQNISVSVNGLSLGAHTIGIRYRDITGKWSIAEFHQFTICTSVPSANIKIGRAHV